LLNQGDLIPRYTLDFMENESKTIILCYDIKEVKEDG